MHNPNIKIYQYLIIYIILFFIYIKVIFFKLSREWRFSYLASSCRYRTAISIDVSWISVPNDNLTKCTLLVQRNPHTMLLSHNALPSPLHASEKACKRESRYDFESTKYYQAFFFFFWKENKISLVYIKLFKV